MGSGVETRNFASFQWGVPPVGHCKARNHFGRLISFFERRQPRRAVAVDAIAKILGNLADFQSQIKSTDSLFLTSEERLSPHMLGRTTGGRTIRLSLPRSTELFDGDILAFDEDVAIVVVAAPEDLFVISPSGNLAWGMVGFQLGNLHRSVRFTDMSILTPADPMVADLLNRLEVPFERRLTPFVGKRFN